MNSVGQAFRRRNPNGIYLLHEESLLCLFLMKQIFRELHCVMGSEFQLVITMFGTSSIPFPDETKFLQGITLCLGLRIPTSN